MTDWNSLRHAYGPAGDLPPILEALTSDASAEAWSGLWSRVCHQGSVYSASYPVLKVLLRIAAGARQKQRIDAISLAGAIAVGENADADHAAELMGYQVELRELRAIALDGPWGEPLSEEDVVVLAEAALALGGDRIWGWHLNRLLSGEFEGFCPHCGVELFLVVGQYGFFAALEEWINRPATPRLPIAPRAPLELSDLGQRLHQRALAAGQVRLASWLQYLFGTGTCLKCGAEFDVQQAVERRGA